MILDVAWDGDAEALLHSFPSLASFIPSSLHASRPS
jgi:hypothetical protein